MRNYELFEMGDKETIMEMYNRFTRITNELKSLGKPFTIEELVRKILRFLPQSWEAKITAIQVIYLAKLTLQTHGAQRTQVKHSRNQDNTNRAKCGLSGQIIREQRIDKYSS